MSMVTPLGGLVPCRPGGRSAHRVLVPAGDTVRGLRRHCAASLEKIKGHRSEEIAAILGYQNSPEVVQRDDLVVL